MYHAKDGIILYSLISGCDKLPFSDLIYNGCIIELPYHTISCLLAWYDNMIMT